jgi:hypothetical protein
MKSVQCSKSLNAALKHKWITEVTPTEGMANISHVQAIVAKRPELHYKKISSQIQKKESLSMQKANELDRVLYNRINLMVPTYKRVKNGKLEKHLNSAIEMASDIKNICYTILVNSDDQETLDFFKSYQMKCDYQIVLTDNIGSPHLAKFFNQMYDETKFNNPEILVSMLGDDMIFSSANYDGHILSKMNEANGYGIVYGDDQYIQHDKMCVNMFTSRRLIDATGKSFMYEIYPVEIIDLIWTEIGKRLNILYYLDHVKIKHEHSTKIGQCEWDEASKRIHALHDQSYDKAYLMYQYVNECVENIRKNLK